jgi:DNA repair exonuclease SbcCD ATPase subunit
MRTLLKPSDDTPDLAAAADALAEELSRYEALATGLARERLDSEKHLRRAAQALGELERSEERLGTRVATLVGAINEANERHATSAEAVRRQAIEIRRRGEVLGSLVERWKLLGEAAAQVNALVKTLRDHLPEAAGLAETLADVETQLTALAGEAGRLGATAEEEGFADLARQAESLRQQLLSLHGKLLLLRQGSQSEP